MPYDPETKQFTMNPPTPEKMDKKFFGQIFKVKNGTAVPEDQWIVFLVKDTAFAETLPTYLENCKKHGADAVQLALVEGLIARMTAWRTAHPELCKVPDAEGELYLP